MNLWIIAYATGYVLMFPRIFSFFLDDLSYGQPDRESVAMSIALAVFVAMIWPGVVMGIILTKFVLNPIADHIINRYKENK